MGQKLIDITGNRYNRLTVLGFDHMEYRTNGKTRSYWKCVCDCGNIVVIRKDEFIYEYSKTKSCGCWHREESSNRKKEKKEGLYKMKIKEGCNLEKYGFYKNDYGKYIYDLDIGNEYKAELYVDDDRTLKFYYYDELYSKVKYDADDYDYIKTNEIYIGIVDYDVNVPEVIIKLYMAGKIEF